MEGHTLQDRIAALEAFSEEIGSAVTRIEAQLVSVGKVLDMLVLSEPEQPAEQEKPKRGGPPAGLMSTYTQSPAGESLT